MNRDGERYSPRTLYMIIGSINRHIQDINSEDSFNILAGDNRFVKCDQQYFYSYE